MTRLRKVIRSRSRDMVVGFEIPGEGTLPLSGPKFQATACPYASTTLERARKRTVAPPHTA